LTQRSALHVERRATAKQQAASSEQQASCAVPGGILAHLIHWGTPTLPSGNMI
jgi:hypothetical protein